MNPFTLLPPKVRLTAFIIVALAGAVLTAIAAGYTGIAQDAPQWVTFGLAAVGSISTLTNAVAATHVYKAPGGYAPVKDPAQVGATEHGGA